MNSETMNTEAFESTYAMLVRSEERERSVSETIVYGLLILSTVLTVWQAAQMPVTVPENLSPRSMAQVTAVHSHNA